VQKEEKLKRKEQEKEEKERKREQEKEEKERKKEKKEAPSSPQNSASDEVLFRNLFAGQMLEMSNLLSLSLSLSLSLIPLTVLRTQGRTANSSVAHCRFS
jgi:hypothetical protein